MQVGRSFWIAGLGLAVAGAAGCASTYNDRGISDDSITAQIQSNIAQDTNLALAGDSHIDIKTRGGHVELTGAVPSERDRREAADVASRVPGVTRVDNDIDVRG